LFAVPSSLLFPSFARSFFYRCAFVALPFFRLLP
jgi:hypothetical protein